MSVGLLRVLVQSQVIVGNQAERYQKALNEHKSIMPMLFEEGIISPRALGKILARG